jgi:hypothetical protein
MISIFTQPDRLRVPATNGLLRRPRNFWLDDTF